MRRLAALTHFATMPDKLVPCAANAFLISALRVEENAISCRLSLALSAVSSFVAFRSAMAHFVLPPPGPRRADFPQRVLQA